MTALWLVVATLATWRLSSLIARERGPFAVGVRLRSLVGVHHRDDGTPARDPDGNLMLNAITPSARIDALLHEIAEGITCIWCCSVWVGMALALLLPAIAPELVFSPGSYVLVVLALSAGTILIAERGL